MKTIILRITGMTCASCSSRIEKVLLRLDGVETATVNLALEEATISYNNEKVGLGDMEDRIRSIGFGIQYKEETFNVSGMTCSACAARIEKVVGKLEAVDHISVNLALEQANVRYQEALLSERQLKEKVEKIGFSFERVNEQEEAKKDPISLYVWVGILLSFPLFWAMADHFTFTEFIWVPELFMNPWFQMLLASPVQFIIGSRFYKSAYSAIKNRSMNMDVLVALGTSAAYFYSVYLAFQSLATYTNHVRLLDIEIILAMVIVVGFFALYMGITQKKWSFDLLVIGPIMAIYGLGYYFAAQRLNPHEGDMPDLYFETSAVLITLIMVGKLLESKAKTKSTKAITTLVKGQAKTALKVNGANEEHIAVDSIQVGDLLLVKAGEKVPVDGKIVKGITTINEAFITGESLPQDKTVGSFVYGSTMNITGAIVVEATTNGNETVLDDIVRVVREAQQSKAPIQRFADRISAIFVPIVVAFALFTFFVWYMFVSPGNMPHAFEAAIAVLVVSCPCALGLATPTSIMAGSGRAAEAGILFKGGEHLELANRVDTVVLDKTGTITEGKPVLMHVFSLQPNEHIWLSYVNEIEKQSNHPLAEAVTVGLQERLLNVCTVNGLEELAGMGMKANGCGESVLIGNRRLLDTYGVSYQALDEQAKIRERKGETVLFVAVGSTVAGFLSLADELKPDSKEGINQLKRMGLDVIMVTGDNPQTAASVAEQVGIEKYKANVLPDGKRTLISAMQEQGAVVAMVGDGINDAPALVTADVGIAIGSGADVAVESADIALISGSLKKVGSALTVSHLTMANIKQNLFWALIYNSIGIPIAAAGLLAPWLAGTAMAFSSVSVVLNALRLQKKTIGQKEGTL
ncbi:copper-translocating P-type ATPase [Shouchella clausii]|uniref:heavy metal translocating P-type ATPase n=1 Tax=Shouchella clausii TaxID=79880 RepID=UPI001B2C7EBD|nr:heavy metal translocating P-type ATPase [Shouchella clausii]GIN08627.1 copper-translocating P-type ATPase [Shouchella clausii]